MLKGLRHTSKGFLMAYCCCLMAMSMLFVGVSFARYTSMTSAVGGGNIAPFVYEYTINDVSSQSFNNSDFVLSTGGNNQVTINAMRSIQFVVKNHKTNGNNVEQISGVDLQPTITIKVPAEFMNNVAFQLAVNRNGSYEAIMPQFVFGHFLYNVTPDSTDPGNIYKYTYGTPLTGDNGSDTYEINTATFPDYAESPYANATYQVINKLELDEANSTDTRSIYNGDVIVSEAVTNNDGITYETRMKVTATTEEVPYSVSFSRKRVSGGAVSELFLNLVRKEQFYTIELTFPGMILAGGEATTKQIVMYYSTVQKMDHVFGTQGGTGDAGSSIQWLSDWNKFFTLAPGSCTHNDTTCPHKIGTAIVTGYSFYQEVPAGTYADGTFTSNGTATVRFNKSYVYTKKTTEAGTTQADTYDMSVKYSIDHVPAIGDNHDKFLGIHHTSAFHGTTDSTNGYFATMAELKGKYAKCSNVSADYAMKLEGLYENPLGDTATEYQLGNLSSKVYKTQFRMSFAQAGEGR